MIREMKFKAYFTNNEYDLTYFAITWQYAAQIAEAHQTITSRLIKLERVDI